LQLTGVLTGYYWVNTSYYWVLVGHSRVHPGYSGVHTGYYGGTQVSRIGAQGGARRGTRLDGCARPLCVGARAAAKACKKCSGYSADRRGYSSGTDHGVRALVSRCRPRAALTCGQRAHMRRVLRDCECGCSRPDHPSANCHPDHPITNKGADSGAVVQPRRYSLPATAGSVGYSTQRYSTVLYSSLQYSSPDGTHSRPPQAVWRGVACLSTAIAMASVACVQARRGARWSVQCIMYNCIAHWVRCVDCCPTGGGVLCSRLRVGRGWEQ
jgi:hypothetical protein